MVTYGFLRIPVPQRRRASAAWRHVNGSLPTCLYAEWPSGCCYFPPEALGPTGEMTALTPRTTEINGSEGMT